MQHREDDAPLDPTTTRDIFMALGELNGKVGMIGTSIDSERRELAVISSRLNDVEKKTFAAVVLAGLAAAILPVVLASTITSASVPTVNTEKITAISARVDDLQERLDNLFPQKPRDHQ